MDNKYMIVHKLKNILNETVQIKGINLSIQASKLLAFIYSEDELKDLYLNKLKAYLDLKNNNIKQYQQEEQKKYNIFADIAISISKNSNFPKYFEHEKIFSKSLDFEFKAVITQILSTLSKEQCFFLNNKGIYNGIFNYYDLILKAYLNKDSNINNQNSYIISVRQKDDLPLLEPQLKLLYDFYYLEHKEKERISSDLEYLNEWIYLKIAIIAVIQTLISDLYRKNEETQTFKDSLKSAQHELLKTIINKKLYEDTSIKTQKDLMDKIYPNDSFDEKNEQGKQRELCKYYEYLLPDDLKRMRKPVTKLFYIAKILKEKF